jgi:hypothetical protein
MSSETLVKPFAGFGSGFTELHAKLDAETSLYFATHRRQNGTLNAKSTRGCWKHDLGFPSHISPKRQLQQ